MRKVLIVTDAWHPQVNGVVRSLDRVGKELRERGYKVRYLTPEQFWTMPMPTYPEIRLSIASLGAVSAYIHRQRPDHIHIATEGPLGLLARHYCVAQHLTFTTSFHTRFPEYVAARLPVPSEWSYSYLRWFHGGAGATMVPTPSAMADLQARQFQNLTLWTRGVDTEQFSPGPKTWFTDFPGPHLLCVGRVAIEKNVEAFLQLQLEGTKIVVGDGPQLAELRRKYPKAVFLGRRVGAELTDIYRSADAFVFPSRTDTFGNVVIEALACGVPVAAYPVIGPRDILTDPRCGALDMDLAVATRQALQLSRHAARHHGLYFTWERATSQFESNLVWTGEGAVKAA